MALFHHLHLHLHHHISPLISLNIPKFPPPLKHTVKASINSEQNTSVEPPKSRRGRKKSTTTTTTKPARKSKKTTDSDTQLAKNAEKHGLDAEIQSKKFVGKGESGEGKGESGNFDDGVDGYARKTKKTSDLDTQLANNEEKHQLVGKIRNRNGVGKIEFGQESGDFGEFDDGVGKYDYPPLICCFGAAQKEFLPTVRVSDFQMHPDIYSEWKMLQWDPPEFVRAPGGPPSNVAIAHVRLGGRAAFMGKVGEDDLGGKMVELMDKEKVQTRGLKIDGNVSTGCALMRIKFDGENGGMRAEQVKESAEDSLLSSELNLSILKEARMFHFNSEVLTSPTMSSTLLKAISWSKQFGGLVFFDPNLPLPLWKSRDETREVIKEAWQQADIIELSRQELEFLLDEEYYENKRNYRPEYYAENYEQTKNRRDYYHYTREEISPLWHDRLKFLFVTDGTLRIHYYSPSFDGVIVGTEDVLITPFTCDRTGSGDAVVAAIIRKLTTQPEMFENQDVLERQLRFAVAAGIIAQWTIGAVRGFPTESATQNLKEQVYVPSMW